jgi:hypothetical protein
MDRPKPKVMVFQWTPGVCLVPASCNYVSDACSVLRTDQRRWIARTTQHVSIYVLRVYLSELIRPGVHHIEAITDRDPEGRTKAGI